MTYLWHELHSPEDPLFYEVTNSDLFGLQPVDWPTHWLNDNDITAGEPSNNYL